MGKLKHLVCTENGQGTLSLGRLGFWLAFIVALYLWAVGNDIKMYHFYTLCIFLLYNFSKKAPIFIQVIKAIKGTDNCPEVKTEPKPEESGQAEG